MNRRVRLVTALVVIVAGGCGVQPDAGPREVPDDNKVNLAGVSTGSDASGADRIYLVEPGQEQLLRSVSRDAASPDDLIETLLRGPNDEELDAQWGSTIPSTLELLAVRSQGSFLYLDVSEALTELGGAGLVQALAQIVYTASELDGVQSVVITVRGEQRAWPKANLESTSLPLRVYDYPGMVRTAQPAYPSIPSGALPA